MSNTLSKAELQILGMLLAGDHEALAALREQIHRCRVKDRWSTGVGFFLDLDVPADAPRTKRRSFTISDVGGQVSGVDVGFVLFVRDGIVDCLECHTWGVGEIPETWQLEGLHYLRHEFPGGASLVRTDVRDQSELQLEAAS